MSVGFEPLFLSDLGRAAGLSRDTERWICLCMPVISVLSTDEAELTVHI